MLTAMERSELRSEVLRVLRAEPQTHVNAIENRLRGAREDFTRGDTLRLQEVVWELLLQGIVAPGKNSLNLHLPFLHVTEYGARCLEEETVLLHDPDGYLAQFEEGLDARVMSAVYEAIQSFLVGRPKATIAMLAAAAERLIDALVTALLASASQGRERGILQTRLTKAGREVVRRAEIVAERLHAGGCLAEDVLADIDVHMGDLIAILRLTRDEVGSPWVREVDHHRAHAALLTFPAACRWCHRATAALRARAK